MYLRAGLTAILARHTHPDRRLLPRGSVAARGAAVVLGVLAALGAAGVAAAEEWKPQRPIRMVLGYTPGGAADAVARAKEFITNSIAQSYKTSAVFALNPFWQSR